MEQFFSAFTYSFMGIFVAMDIIGLTPIYLALTKHTEKPKLQSLLNQSITVATIVAFGFVFLGKYIFKILGIQPYDFQIAGGVVLLVISIIELVQGKQLEHADKRMVGIVPLAVPLITGPGVITIVMLQVGIYGYGVVTASLLANFLFAWLTLSNSRFVFKFIGEQGAEVVSKVAVLFMTAFSFAMIRIGFLQALADIKH